MDELFGLGGGGSGLLASSSASVGYHDELGGTAAAGGSGGEGQLVALKRTIQGYVQAKDQDSLALAEAQAEIEVLRERIVHLQAQKRGLNAIPENAAAIARHKELMERRLVKAREQQMATLANNTTLRERVNELRREKATIVVLCAALRDDAARLAQDSIDTDNRIAALHAKCEEVEAQTDGMHEECKMEVAALEADNKRLQEEEKQVDARAAQLEMIAAQLMVGETTPAAAMGAASAGSPGAARALAQSSGQGRDTRRRSRDMSKTGVLPPNLNPADRPLSRQIESLIASGKQPSIAELRMTARGLDPSKSRSMGALPTIHDDGGDGLPELPIPTGSAAVMLHRGVRSGAGRPSSGRRDGSMLLGGSAAVGSTSRVLSHARWQMGLLEAKRSTMMALAENMKEAFDRAISAVSAVDLDDFCNKFLDAQREAEMLYRRVADTTREADALRTQLVDEWAAFAADGERTLAEDAERRALIAAVESKLHHAIEKASRLRDENRRLTALTETCRRGLGRLQEILSGETSAIEDAAGAMAGTEDTGASRGATQADAAPMEGGPTHDSARPSESGAADGARGTARTQGDAAPRQDAQPADATEGQVAAVVVQPQQQDIVTLYTIVETLLATTIAMYSHYLHGVRIPLALPSAALVHAVSQSNSNVASGSASMQRLLASSPIGASPRGDMKAGAESAVAQRSGTGKQTRDSVAHGSGDDVPAVRSGIVTVTASERRASLEMSLIDMRKGLLAEAAKSPTGGARGNRAKSSAGGATSTRSGSRGEGSTSARTRGRSASGARGDRTVSTAHMDRDSPVPSPDRTSARPGSRSVTLAPGTIPSPTAAAGGRRASRGLEGMNFAEVLMSPSASRGVRRSISGSRGAERADDPQPQSGAPVITLSTLRVGPDSPTRAASQEPAQNKRSARLSASGPGLLSSATGGVQIVPPPVEGPAAAQILQHARAASRGGKLPGGAGLVLPTTRSTSSLLHAMSGRSLLSSTTGGAML